jgi:hypothetical protein
MVASPDAYQVNAGIVPKSGSSNKTINDMTQDFGGDQPKYSVTLAGNSWILNSTEGEVFLYVDKKGDYSVLNADQVRSAYIRDAEQFGSVEKLREKLYKANYMDEAEYKLKDQTGLNTAIIRAARQISVDAVSNFTDTQTPLTQSFSTWINKRIAVSGASGAPDSGVSLTSRTQTNQDIDEFFNEYLSRPATEAEKTSYYNKVNAEEKKAVTKRSVSGGKETVVGERLDATDYFRIRASILAPSVKGTAIEDIAKGNGRIAQDVSELKAYAADYGIKLDSKQALDKVLSGLKPGGSLTTGKLDAEKTSIKEMSKIFYNKLSPLIDQGVKISDIAGQFAYYKGQLLELPDNAVSVFDEDIQAALKNEGKDGVMSLTEYQKFLRTNPKTKSQWLKTKGAKEEAAGYANSILKSFGLMA